MYREIIKFDQDSFLELCSRLTGDGEQLMLAIRGRKNTNEATIASVCLNAKQVEALIVYLNSWKPRELNVGTEN